jgi:general secretion pathway protein K
VNRMRGVALIIALVVVTLATMMATRIGSQSSLDQRRASTLMAQEQAFQIALGAEAWAIEVLREDAATTKHDSLDEPWAAPLPPLPIDGGQLQASLEDMQGRFNLNNLLKPDGTQNMLAVAQFTRLLTALGLETKWADVLLDWIDADTTVSGNDGAEDSSYTSLTPAYRTANRPIASISELLALPDFGAERYRQLAPYVAALPVGTPLNVCTASGVVLDSIAPGLGQYTQGAAQLAVNRQKGCFPALADIQAAAGALIRNTNDRQAVVASLSDSTHYFRGKTVVSLGTTQLTLYSLIERHTNGSSRVVLRTLSTE